MSGEVDWSMEGAAVRARNANKPGDIKVKPLPRQDDEWGWYWTAYVDGQRINGGLATDFQDGMRRAKNAIAAYRDRMFLSQHYWDVETASWILRDKVVDLWPV